MTSDELIQLCCETGVYVSPIGDFFQGHIGDLEKLCRRVESANSEAACKIIYGLAESDNVAQRMVDAIRARGRE